MNTALTVSGFVSIFARPPPKIQEIDSAIESGHRACGLPGSHARYWLSLWRTASIRSDSIRSQRHPQEATL